MTLTGGRDREVRNAMEAIAAESAPPVATGELAAVRFGGNPKSDRADEQSPPSDTQSPFDAVRRVRADGSEYWAGRELMPLMAYVNWQNFAEVVERAKASGRNTGMDVTTSFTGVDQAGFITGHSPYDYHLSREAAYLVAMNGDPRKPEVAAAQATKGGHCLADHHHALHAAQGSIESMSDSARRCIPPGVRMSPYPWRCTKQRLPVCAPLCTLFPQVSTRGGGGAHAGAHGCTKRGRSVCTRFAPITAGHTASRVDGEHVHTISGIFCALGDAYAYERG